MIIAEHINKKKAIELWNTWEGRYKEISPAKFNEVNDHIERAYPFDRSGNYIKLSKKEMFGRLYLTSNGAYITSWRKIERAIKESELVCGYSTEEVYKLRVRWRLIEKSYAKLKSELAKIISLNDENNNFLNSKILEWNKKIVGTNLPIFEENDLRGVDLSGLDIRPLDHDRVQLKNVDLSFSSCAVLQIKGANLYGSKLIAIFAPDSSFADCICARTTFLNAFLSRSKFQNTCLSFSDLKYSLCHLVNFDGANLYKADVGNSQLTNCSFNYVDLVSQNGYKYKKYPCLDGIRWNTKTLFSNSYFVNLENSNPVLLKYIKEKQVGQSLSKENIPNIIADTVEVKPSLFGISIDIKKILFICLSLFKRGK